MKDKQQRPPPPEVVEPLMKGIVARGHTVEIPTGEKIFRCFDARGEALYRAITRRFSPGDEVELPRSEVLRLQELGFVEDPAKVVRGEAKAAQLLGAEVVELARGVVAEG